MAEHSFRKAEVVGPTPTIGCVKLEEKYNLLQEILGELGRVLIAYSGGVDSTFLLKAAVDTLGAENVVACIAAGPTLPKDQYERAIKTANDMGVKPMTVEPDELADEKFTANKADRCFHCKKHLFEILSHIAKDNNCNYIICGHNLDDNSDYRPGSKAIKQFQVRCPLAEAGLSKNDIRQLSRKLNLPTADIPASPCLASRISYGLKITPQCLKQIEDAEDLLRSMGLVEFRVRHHDTIARIEVHPQDIEKITAESNRLQIVEKLKALGFTYVTIDLQSFRSGSLNESLSEQQKQKAFNP